MDSKMELKVYNDAANERVVIETWKNGALLGQMYLTGSEAEQHMSDVSDARAKLNEQVVDDLNPGTSLAGITNPKWKSWAQPDGSVPLLLRHLGFGWQLFVFPKHEAKALSEWLVTTTTAQKS